MESALDLDEEVLMRHPPDRHCGGPKRGFHPSQQAVEFGKKFFVVLPGAFDTFASRKTQTSARFHFSLPLEVRRFVVSPGVPDEIKMEKMLQIVGGGLPAPP